MSVQGLTGTQNSPPLVFLLLSAVLALLASMGAGFADETLRERLASGQNAFRVGDYGAAERQWQPCALPQSPPGVRAAALVGLAQLALARGDIPTTLEHLETAEPLLPIAGRGLEAVADTVRAEAEGLTGNYPQALARLDEVLAGEGVTPTILAAAAARKARISMEARDRRSLDAALSRLFALFAKNAALPALRHAGAVAIALEAEKRLNRPLDAARMSSLLEQGIVRARAGGDTAAEMHLLALTADLYTRRDQPGQALASLETAARLNADTPDPHAQMEVFARLGRLYERRGDLHAAADAMERAAAAIESVQNDLLPYGGLGRSYQDEAAPIFRTLADIRLRQARAADDQAVRTALVRQAKDDLIRLRTAELQDYFDRQCLARAASEPGEARGGAFVGIYPFIRDDRIELLVETETDAFVVSSPARARTVRALAQNFRRRVQNPRDARYLPFARRLYDLILRPVLSDERVAPGAPLVFVPDGVLRTIPLAALHDGDGFVIETRSVTISPDRADTARPRPARLAGGTLVAALSEQREDFSPLPAARSEAVAVARLIDARQLLNDDFQTERFATFLREVRPDIVHVASHGVFSGSYGESFLLASDGRLNFNDLEDQLSAGREAGEPISLLALSACQTAVGDERAALGLAGIALKAGAQSALASLWSISDEATATLMVRFYEELSRNTAIDKAEALRQAQLALLRSSPTRHPAFWSSFLLVSQSG